MTAGKYMLEKSQWKNHQRNFLSNIANSTDRIYCFSISKKERDTESESVVYYDYKKKKWRAGRYIGNIEWSSEEKELLFPFHHDLAKRSFWKWWGEIFNFKLTVGKSGSRAKILYT